MSTTTASVPHNRSSSYSGYDPLAEFERPQAAIPDLRQSWRTAGGVLLAGAGLGLSLWIAYLVHAAVFRPEKLALLQRLVPSQPADLELTIPQGRVGLPPAVMPFLAYVLLIVMTAIAARVAAALVKEGAWLLRHDPPADVTDLAGAGAPPLSTPPHGGG